MSSDPLLVFCTCPNREIAQTIAGAVVSEAAAACVNIVPGLTSVYVWDGEVQQDEEWLLLIKSTGDAYPRLETIVSDLHPYELPELIAVPVVQGLPDYLQWMRSSSQPERER